MSHIIMLLLIKGSKQSTTNSLYRKLKKNLSRDGEILKTIRVKSYTLLLMMHLLRNEALFIGNLLSNGEDLF